MTNSKIANENQIKKIIAVIAAVIVLIVSFFVYLVLRHQPPLDWWNVKY